MRDRESRAHARRSPTAGGISRLVKLVFGFGAAARGVKDSAFGGFLMLYYNQVLGLPGSWVGTALFLSLVVDACTDPLIGHVSDRWRSRWGRRHPFMYFAAVPTMLSFYLVWNPPVDLSHEALFAYLLGTVLAVRFFITFYEIPSNALVAELSDDYVERTSLFGIRSFFGWTSGLLMTVITFALLLRPTIEHPVGQLNEDGYRLLGLVSGVIILVAMAASSLVTHRYIRMLRQPPPPRPVAPAQAIREIVQTLSNRSALALLVAGVFVAMGMGLTGSLQIYFDTYFWGLTSAEKSIIGLGGFPAIVGAALIAPPLTRRFGKKETELTVIAAITLIGLAPYVLRFLGWFPPNGSTTLLVILFGVTTTTIMLSVVSTITTMSMMADVVEDSEVQTGRRSEGLLLAASNFVMQCVGGLGIFTSGLVLSAIEFPAGASPQSIGAGPLRDLMLTYIPILVTLNLLTIAFLSRYRIDRHVHAANLQELARRANERVTANGH